MQHELNINVWIAIKMMFIQLDKFNYCWFYFTGYPLGVAFSVSQNKVRNNLQKKYFNILLEGNYEAHFHYALLMRRVQILFSLTRDAQSAQSFDEISGFSERHIKRQKFISRWLITKQMWLNKYPKSCAKQLWCHSGNISCSRLFDFWKTFYRNCRKQLSSISILFS